MRAKKVKALRKKVISEMSKDQGSETLYLQNVKTTSKRTKKATGRDYNITITLDPFCQRARIKLAKKLSKLSK